jgi:hypothetical protein
LDSLEAYFSIAQAKTNKMPILRLIGYFWRLSMSQISDFVNAIGLSFLGAQNLGTAGFGDGNREIWMPGLIRKTIQIPN